MLCDMPPLAREKGRQGFDKKNTIWECRYIGEATVKEIADCFCQTASKQSDNEAQTLPALIECEPLQAHSAGFAEVGNFVLLLMK